MARLQGRHTATGVSLPGVGERLDVTDVAGAPIHVVRRRSGVVEWHASGSTTELDAWTAMTVGAFVSGHFLLPPELAERMSDVLGGLVFDWVRLEAEDRAVGRTIAELAVRQRTRVTIVAILRGSVPIVGPDPDAELRAGDDLVIVGSEHDRDEFVRYMTGDV